MKKLLVVILAVGMLFIAARNLWADASYVREPGYTVKVFNHSGGHVATLSSTIIAGNRVLGFTFSDSSAGCGILWDAATAGARADSNIFGEAYSAAGGVSTVIFPFPKKVENGLVTAVTNNTTGRLLVYYE